MLYLLFFDEREEISSYLNDGSIEDSSGHVFWIVASQPQMSIYIYIKKIYNIDIDIDIEK